MNKYQFHPLYILLVQQSEHSMDIMSEKLKEFADANAIPTFIKSVPLTDVWDNLTGVDVILLDPRLSAHERNIRRMVRDEIPVFPIDTRYFGPAPVNQVWKEMTDELNRKSISLSGPF